MANLTKKRLVAFLRKWVGEDDDFQVMSSKEGKRFSEHACGLWYVSFDGSALYSLFNSPSLNGFVDKFEDFLHSFGCWFEQGHAWNCNIMKED